MDGGSETANDARPPAGRTETSLTGDEPELHEFFGEAHRTIVRFAEMLAFEGVRRGLIGPREVPRLWGRHLVNCGTVTGFLPATGVVVDVGSGAGLPGVVLAAMRPDLQVVLLEPMERRVVWLHEVVGELGLTSVEVRRGRAEDSPRGAFDTVTARAVAPLDRLATWTLPLLRPGGALVAMKGERAQEELDSAQDVLRSLGAVSAEVLSTPVVAGVPATKVVRVVQGEQVPAARSASTAPSRTAPKRGRKARRGR